MSRVWNTQASHTVGVAPLGKVTLERFRPFVRVVSANFAIVADVEDSSHKHPLRHAAMNAIDAVAHAQGGGAWPRDVGDVTLKDSNEKCYLLTGYDVYLSREPCCMCAMSLVHSRVGRIFFFNAGNEERRKFGALESAVKLHAVEGLNHSFDVFCVETTS